MKDKIIVITGASEGLGKASAIKLAVEGAKVVLIAHNPDELQEVAKEIGNQASFYVCDVASSEQIRNTVEKIVGDLGRVDILINNAGVWTLMKSWRRLIQPCVVESLK